MLNHDALSNPTNWCSESGAQQLAEQIRDYWSRRGSMLPKIEIVAEGGVKTPGRTKVYCVRSNMIGGWPQ